MYQGAALRPGADTCSHLTIAVYFLKVESFHSEVLRCIQKQALAMRRFEVWKRNACQADCTGGGKRTLILRFLVLRMGSMLWDVRSSVHVLRYLRHVAVVDGRHSDQLRLDVEACATRAHGTSIDRPRGVGHAAWLVDACVSCSQDCRQTGPCQFSSPHAW